MIRLYGISNCDKVRAARRWLEQSGHDYEYHDFRQDGLHPDQITAIKGNQLINKRSTTWRNLNNADQALESDQKLIQLLIKHPTLIKRPVLEADQDIHFGFSPAEYESIFNKDLQ
jgi:arsenate reductase